MHMNNALLLQGDVHELKIDPGGSVALVSENGLDVLALFLRRKSEASDEIVVNNNIAGEWGEERVFLLPTAPGGEISSVWFKSNDDGLEVWTAAYAGKFERFTAKTREKVRFVRLNQAVNCASSLTASLDSVDYTAAEIEAHLLYRRMDDLERRLTQSDAPTKEPV